MGTTYAKRSLKDWEKGQGSLRNLWGNNIDKGKRRDAGFLASVPAIRGGVKAVRLRGLRCADVAARWAPARGARTRL